MAELVWRGKNRGGASSPQRRAVPVRPLEVYGARHGGWRNRLVLGDVAHALPALARELAGQVALVYIDPPFETGGDFDFRARIPGTDEDTPRIPVRAYGDARGLDAWLEWFHGAAVTIRELLIDGGSLYVHLDAHVAHYAKVLLDEAFGPGAFQREIVWRIGWISGFKSRARGWIRNHDTLLFYAKGKRPRTFNKEYLPYPPGYIRRDGKPPRGEGHPIDDVWNAGGVDRLDSIQIMSFSGEKVGYPTQKNEALVARVVRASSDPGDIVLDCFVGSGTTAVVAEKLGRRWVACDQSPVAIHSTRKRLLALPEIRGFVVEDTGAEPSGPGRRLSIRSHVEGRRATLEISSFAIPAREAPAHARASVAHWSQWIEGWCVDWDHKGGALHVGSHMWRSRPQVNLPLSATHAYGRPGHHVALVKTFDALGGVATSEVGLEIT